MKKIALIGSTGSIGRQVLNCVDRHKDKFQIVSLTANSNAKLLNEQIEKYNPKVAVLTNPENLSQISCLGNTNLYYGDNAMIHAITEDADIVVVAVVGFCGLKAVIQAIKMDKIIALANKESLVCGGEIVKSLLDQHKMARILPVDSEHSAIWQSLGLDENRSFKNLILTASGGAFRDKTLEELNFVTANDALKHPNWQMGKKITIDCATMLNKGLEVMEAMWLFNCPLEKIKVVVHPESIIHSMVEYEDSSVVAQLAYPSMEIPIQLALSYPDRLHTDVKSYNFFEKPLTFREVDHNKYPCFDLAIESAKQGDNVPCILSSANEEAVSLFLQDKIKYLEIPKYIEIALNKVSKKKVSFENLIETDFLARNAVLSEYKRSKI